MKTHINIHLSDIFKALGDPVRLRIAKLFLHAGRSLCVCEIVDALQLPQYQVSRQLAVLKESGFVSTHRRGTWVYYDVDRESPKLKHLLRCLEEDEEDEQQRADSQRLMERLSLRMGGICVVGFSEKERTKETREKGTSNHGTTE